MSIQGMSSFRVRASREIAAAPEAVYAVLADYRNHHPHIVPKRYFRRLEVLEGGVGAGTRTRVEMRVMGATIIFEQAVTEPEPGRVLMETNTDGSAITTFTVAAVDGRSAHVTIATDLPLRPGLAGRIGRTLISLMLERIYRQELAQLEAYVSRR